MRHGASLLTSLEGMSKPAFHIARELCNNSRSGLTVRFLSKKLELPEEEIEYILDTNQRLMFIDLTKVKIVSEGHGAVKRIVDGLENLADVPSIYRQVKGLDAIEYRQLEERLGFTEAPSKKAAAEALIERVYGNPDSLVTYVATQGFSQAAREVFDLVWNSPTGILPLAQIRRSTKRSEFDVEQALWELFRGFALFEMFRFDGEERLVRAAGLLSELRQFREREARSKRRKAKLKALRSEPPSPQVRGIELSETLCRLVAAIAARPARLRGDGDLFREDKRRLGAICPEEDEPSLSTCLWMGEGLDWLARVDSLLKAGSLDRLLPLDRVSRHRLVFDWLTRGGEDRDARALMKSLVDDLKIGAWYPVRDIAEFAAAQGAESEQPTLRQAGAHWEYASATARGRSGSRLVRALEEPFTWLGLVDRAEVDGDTVVRLTELGEALLREDLGKAVHAQFPQHAGQFVVQPNFDIVVPTHEIDPLLTVPLDQFAVRGSTGVATVYNLSKDSFTQAMQEGHDPDAFVSFLLANNRGESLPPNVLTTLEDWRGAAKRVRLKTIHVLETEDALVLADLLHRKRLARFFEPLNKDHAVQYVGISHSDLAKALEKDGFIVE